MKKYAAMAVMSVVLAGCASNQPQQSADYQYTPPTPVAITSNGEIAKPYDLTWARAERWLKEHNLAATNQDRAAGLLSVTQADYVDGLKYLDCGNGGSKVAIANPDVKLNLIITPNGDKSAANVNLKAPAASTTSIAMAAGSPRHPSPPCAYHAACWKASCCNT